MSYFDATDTVEPFYLLRETDETGVSGTGIVAMGAKLPSGVCVMNWRSIHPSLEIVFQLDDILKLHGHDGKTKLIMGNPPKKKQKSKK